MQNLEDNELNKTGKKNEKRKQKKYMFNSEQLHGKITKQNNSHSANKK